VESCLSYVSSKESLLLAPADPVAEAVRLLRPRSLVLSSLHAGGSWAVRHEAFPHVRLGVVATGACWLVLDGAEPVRLREGDFYLLGNPPGHVLASDPAETPRAASSVWGSGTGGSARMVDGLTEDTYVCGGHFALEAGTGPLTDVLPALVLVRADDPRGASLRHLSELLVTEAEATAVGATLVLDHLAQVLFVYLLRAHAEQDGRPTGWLAALRSDGVGTALRAMHADVSHRWTLAELADVGRMSRSSFAAAFRDQVGTTPLNYLIEWRMSLARDALRHGSMSISQLAVTTGYESESAFSTAFRRVVGVSPRQFRDGARIAVDAA
jgi:AraC-like DNA-binding protein